MRTVKSQSLFLLLSLALLVPFSFAGDSEKIELQTIMQHLQTGGYREQWEALDRIIQLGPQAAELAPVLKEFKQKSPFEELIAFAIIAERRIQHYSPEQVESLIQALNSTLDLEEQSEVLMMLGYIGKQARAAVPELQRIALNHDDNGIRTQATVALGMIGVDLDDFLAVLAEKMRITTNPYEKGMIAMQLGNLGPTAMNAVPDLLNNLKNADYRVQGMSILALGYIRSRPERVVPALIQILNKIDSEESESALAVRNAATGTLGNFAPPSEEQIHALLNALQNDKPMIRTSAARSLGQLGSYAKDAIPVIEKIIKEASPDFKIELAKAYHKITFKSSSMNQKNDK